MTQVRRTEIAHRSILVTGAQGVSGAAVLEHYAANSANTVYGLSRRSAESHDNIRHISVDLLDRVDIMAKLSVIPNPTHLVFGAYVDKKTPPRRARSTLSF